MVLTLIQQGLGLRPREKRALCGKMGDAGPALQNLGQHYTIIESMSRVTRASPVVCKQ